MDKANIDRSDEGRKKRRYSLDSKLSTLIAVNSTRDYGLLTAVQTELIRKGEEQAAARLSERLATAAIRSFLATAPGRRALKEEAKKIKEKFMKMKKTDALALARLRSEEEAQDAARLQSRFNFRRRRPPPFHCSNFHCDATFAAASLYEDHECSAKHAVRGGARLHLILCDAAGLVIFERYVSNYPDKPGSISALRFWVAVERLKKLDLDSKKFEQSALKVLVEFFGDGATGSDFLGQTVLREMTVLLDDALKSPSHFLMPMEVLLDAQLKAFVLLMTLTYWDFKSSEFGAIWSRYQVGSGVLSERDSNFVLQPSVMMREQFSRAEQRAAKSVHGQKRAEARNFLAGLGGLVRAQHLSDAPKLGDLRIARSELLIDFMLAQFFEPPLPKSMAKSLVSSVIRLASLSFAPVLPSAGIVIGLGALPPTPSAGKPFHGFPRGMRRSRSLGSLRPGGSVSGVALESLRNRVAGSAVSTRGAYKGFRERRDKNSQLMRDHELYILRRGMATLIQRFGRGLLARRYAARLQAAQALRRMYAARVIQRQARVYIIMRREQIGKQQKVLWEREYGRCMRQRMRLRNRCAMILQTSFRYHYKRYYRWKLKNLAREKVKMYVFRLERIAQRWLREKHAFVERTRRGMSYRMSSVLIREELRKGDWLEVLKEIRREYTKCSSEYVYSVALPMIANPALFQYLKRMLLKANDSPVTTWLRKPSFVFWRFLAKVDRDFWRAEEVRDRLQNENMCLEFLNHITHNSEPDRNHRPGRSNFSILGDARLAPVRRAYNVTLASLKPGSINEERDSIYFRFFKEEELCPSCFCFVNLNRFGECVKCAAPARHMREAAPKLRTAISKYNLKSTLDLHVDLDLLVLHAGFRAQYPYTSKLRYLISRDEAWTAAVTPSLGWTSELKRKGLRTVSSLAAKRRDPGLVALVRSLDLPESLGAILESFCHSLDLWIDRIINGKGEAHRDE